MDIYAAARALRAVLHEMPEASGCESRTKAALMDYLKEHSTLELVDGGSWFYAAHREPGATEGITLRADMDAVTGEDGRPFHGCGHDGHMAVLAALAAGAEGKRFGKNVFFLFQSAEESGAGAPQCLPLFDKERVDAIYGFHNCPGFPAGAILLRHGTFACASKGLTLRFHGVQSHAAYPENGKNPVFPMAALFARWNELTNPHNYKGMVLATPVCFRAGEVAFGVAAGSGQLGLTLRGWLDEDLQKLEDAVVAAAGELAAQAGVELRWEEQDVFPATRNDESLFAGAAAAANAAGLPALEPAEPFRWSEDFGWYGSRAKAFFFGVGGGEDAAGLHTPQYAWNDAVTDAALRFYTALLAREK